MARTFFITGADGFIGRALVADLVAAGPWHVVALTRRPVGETRADGPTLVTGDLREPATYVPSIGGVDTVIHLAAVTGKAAPSDYEQTNVRGTKHLLDACQKLEIRRFLYVSTIAAAYTDQRHYLYAQSKARAEALVRQSGIPSTIIRPTIVVGAGSPIWRTLSRVAKFPLIPLPDGGCVRVQPIHLDDLIAAIKLIVAEKVFYGETLDLGGPESMSLADLMRAMHRARSGRDPLFLRFPLSPVRTLLALVEPVLPLPVTAGQLALFANDSTPDPNWLHDLLKKEMRPTGETLATAVELPTATTGKNSSAAIDLSLNREVDVFSRYLVGQYPTDYVRRQYEAALIARNLANDSEFPAFDCNTLKLARRHFLITGLADAYCAAFYRDSVLRRKLILLLAILEHTAPTAAHFESPKNNRGVIGVGMTLLGLGIKFTVSLLAGVILLLPLHIFSLRSSIKLEGNTR